MKARFFPRIGLAFFLWVAFYVLSPISVFADTLTENTNIGCRIAIESFTDVPSLGCLAQVVVNGVQWAYGFSLIAGMAYFIFGGITFMMAQDEKGIKAGRDKMVWAVFGFIFIVVSFLAVRVFFLLLGFPDLVNNFSLFVPLEP